MSKGDVSSVSSSVTPGVRVVALPGWTVDTLYEYIHSMILEREKQSIERYHALEAATSNNFSLRDNQINTALLSAREAVGTLEKAMLAGFQAREKEVAVALSSIREAMAIGFETRERAVSAAFASTTLSVLKAEAATERRFDSVNEFRGTLTDQTRNFVPRLELDQRFMAIEKSIGTIGVTTSTSEGRSAGLSQGWGYLLGAAGMIIAVLTVVVSFLRR